MSKLTHTSFCEHDKHSKRYFINKPHHFLNHQTHSSLLWEREKFFFANIYLIQTQKDEADKFNIITTC